MTVPASRLLLAAVFAVAWVAALACASDGDDAPAGTSTVAAETAYTFETVANGGPHAVGVTTLRLIDPSRPTAANREYAGSPQREFEVEVWYPVAGAVAVIPVRDARPSTEGAPYPLIIFAHGYASSRMQSLSYTMHLASHGYVVAAIDFPSTRLTSPGGPRLQAIADQPADISFVIDELHAASEGGGTLLGGSIDKERTGVTGHSLGGLTAMLTVYGGERDARVDGAVAFAPPGCFLPEDVAGDAEVPMLVVGGSRDLIVNPESIRAAYERSNAPRYFASLSGSDHLRFIDSDRTDEEVIQALEVIGRGEFLGDVGELADAVGGELESCEERPDVSGVTLMPASRQRELMRAFATPFFDAYLKDNEAARRFLEEELPGIVPDATFEQDSG